MNEDLEILRKDAEIALWKIQEYFNNQSKEQINNYIGSCKNHGALKIYQLRIDFNEKFPSKKI